MPEQAVTCVKCGIKKGEGTNYCQYCGFLTTMKTEYCHRCGAKQITIIPQRIKNEKIENLSKALKANIKAKRVYGWIAVGSLLVAIVIFAYMCLRPAPANIPEFGTASMTRVGDTYYYDSSVISDEVAEYWAQGRALLSGILVCFIIFFISLIGFLTYKIGCKSIRKKIQKMRG